jgi:hypothetical protein
MARFGGPFFYGNAAQYKDLRCCNGNTKDKTTKLPGAVKAGFQRHAAS